MKNAEKRLKKALYSLLLMDYTVDLGVCNDYDPDIKYSGVVSVDFSRLSSVYSAHASGFTGPDGVESVSINWQYARENKAAGKRVSDVLDCMAILNENGLLHTVRPIFGHYKAAAELVYKAKYSTDQWLYTEGV